MATTKAVKKSAPVKAAAKAAAKKSGAVSAQQLMSNALNVGTKLMATAGPSALAPTTNFSNELNNIDFRKMIGGPLQACVDAQVASSLATVSFIKEVAFKKDAQGVPTQELVMADFSYKKTDGAPGAQPVTTEVKVPLIAMLPIPSLRIEYAEVNFNVKLNSVETSNTSTAINVGLEAKAGWGPVSLKVTASVQRNTSTGVKVEKEYSLNVKVRAVQDEMPAGLEKVLNLLSA